MTPLLRTIALIAVLAICDLLAGYAVGALFFRTRVGSNGGDINRAIERRAPVLLLGGSRAHGNVDTDALSQRLGIDIENLGADGHGLAAWLMIFDIVSSEYTPQRVFLVLDEHSFRDRPDVLQKVRFLAPYLDRSPLTREVIYGLSPFERIKYVSTMYRFNGKLLSSLKNLNARSGQSPTGFVAIDGRLGSNVEPGRDSLERPFEEFEPWTTALFTRFVERCQRTGIELTILTTPSYEAMPVRHAAWRASLIEILRSYEGVTLVEADQYARPGVFDDASLFRDPQHMNVAGTARLSLLLGDLLSNPDDALRE